MPHGEPILRPPVPLSDRDLLAEQLLSDLEVAVLIATDDEPILRLQAMWDGLKTGCV
jgi:hypothetical protein